MMIDKEFHYQLTQFREFSVIQSIPSFQRKFSFNSTQFMAPNKSQLETYQKTMMRKEM